MPDARQSPHLGTKRRTAILGILVTGFLVINIMTKSVRKATSSVSDVVPKEQLRKLPSSYQKYPLMIQMIQDNSVNRLDLDWKWKCKGPKRRNHYWINGPIRNQGSLPKEVSKGCKPVAKWANEYHPTCNGIHEVGMGHLIDSSGLETSRLVGSGANRDVWSVREFDGTKRALKTLQMSKKWEIDVFDRNREDAVASEQLSASPYVMSIYGNCLNSAIFDFGDGGELSDVHGSNPSKDELLRIAHEVVSAVADAHHVDDKGRATIAHADIHPGQFLKINGRYMLNDFNRCRFLSWDRKKDVPCGFKVKTNGHGVVSMILI